MAGPRVLTFNFHEPYLCLMARTGYEFAVGLYSESPFCRVWQGRFRPLPPNISFLPERQWREEIDAGMFDVVIAHNEDNALDILPQLERSGVPGILVCHNRRSYLETTIPDGESGKKRYAGTLERLRAYYDFVFISETKRSGYGIEGRVIAPGIDVEEYGGFHGVIPEVLRVGNLMRARTLMFDVGFQEEVCRGIPNRVAGEDPGIANARPSTSFPDLLEMYRGMRCLLHVTREAYEDGYNLAMLEAMACGMPVVSLANPTSPLTNGVDGYVSYDANELRARIQELLADRERAIAIGAKGRETVARTFPLASFVSNWRQAIEETAGKRRRARSERPLPRLRILMEYMASPINTGRYFHQALVKKHEVVTAGLRCPEETLAKWGFPENPPPYPPHPIDLPLRAPYADMAAKLPEGFQPDLFFWVDYGAREIAKDLHIINAPKICYLIDTHLAPEFRIEIAKEFDFVFLAQRGQIEMFKKAGITNVYWLPLACSPELHDVGEYERTFDVAYVGKPQAGGFDNRDKLLARLAERYPNNAIGPRWPAGMARTYAQSKIVVNACVNRDVNMRVFEAMASGALLITDPADGLDELFRDGEHLVVYHGEEELYQLIDRYLADDAARTRIARAGQSLVLAKHTYDKRVETMLRTVLEELGYYGGMSGEARFSKGGYYRSPRRELAPFVPWSARRVLDCGCGGGEFGRLLKRRGVREVVGIEIVERAWEMAKQALDNALLGNIEEMELPFDDGYFDCVCFTDVLEHLVDPGAVLRKVSRVLAPDGCIVMSLPNARYYEIVQMLANGRWKYQDSGIMDRTHLRFFTPAETRSLIVDAGLQPVLVSPLSAARPEQLPRDASGALRLGRMTIENVSDTDYAQFLTFQIVAVAMKPGADPLAGARRLLEDGHFEAAYAEAGTVPGADDLERKAVQAAALGRLGKLDTAESLYREVLNAKPTHSVARGGLGIVLVACHHFDEAIEHLDMALMFQPENPRFLASRGIAHHARGDHAAAFHDFMRSLSIRIQNDAVAPHFIPLALELSREAEAQDIARRLAEFYSGNTRVQCAYAQLLEHLGRYDEAIERMDTICMLTPDDEGAQALRDAMRSRVP